MKWLQVILIVIFPVISYIGYDVIFTLLNPVKPQMYETAWIITTIMGLISLVVWTFWDSIIIRYR
jgi:hypothetical protein